MNTISVSTHISYRVTTVLFLLFAHFSNHAAAQPVDRAKVVVSYTYNFAKHIEWPEENKLASFNIALFEVGDQTLSNEFFKLNNSVSLKNVPVRIEKQRNINALTKYNMIYVGPTTNSTIVQIQKLIEGKPILLVTSNFMNKRLVMINLFETQNQKLKFEVNKANIINSNLKPLPELILLGGTEIDVAKLYREGQSSLVSLQNQLASQQGILSDLRKKSSLQKKSNQRLVNQMKQLNNDIITTQTLNTALTKELGILDDAIEKSKITIDQQQKEIKNSEKQKKRLITQVTSRNKELNEKELQLENKQKRLEAISQSISEQESKLTQLNLTIDQQQISLDEKQTSINELDQLVSAQQRWLYAVWGLVGAVAAFLFVSIYAYRIKRIDNQRLSLRSQELQIARDKLEIEKRKAETANRTKSAFLSLMSHELRTPLQSIIGYTDLVIEDLKAEGNHTYSDQLIRVNTNGERLLELINNTLYLAKIEAEKMDVRLTPTNIGALIEEAIGNVKPLLSKNNNKLSTYIDNNSRTPDIDYEKLLHILVNLLSNATKFTKNGVITINVKNKPESLTLIVKDTGIGLSKEQAKKVFTQFHQANNKTSRKSKGTGLGLSITQYFCELMGGNIRVESKEKNGTAFIVDIPLPVVVTNKKFIGIDIEELVA